MAADFPSIKHHGLVAVDDDAIFEVPADGLGEDDFLEVAAEALEVFHVVTVGDVADVLGDDGAFIEDRGDVMRGGADNFHAASVGLMVGFGPGEGG